MCASTAFAAESDAKPAASSTAKADAENAAKSEKRSVKKEGEKKKKAEDEWADDAFNDDDFALEEKEPLINYKGFIDARGGMRPSHDRRISRDATVAETRAQIELWKEFAVRDHSLRFQFKGDAILDGVDETGDFKIREAYASYDPFDWIVVKAGRQVLTWGTGDLVFINDLFPKDWVSFFIGRDEEYLKSPSDALKISLYPGFVSIDFVYTPQFDPDRYITGRRISYYNPLYGRTVGDDGHLQVDEPDAWFAKDSEFALRIYKNISGNEIALYGYHGSWKSPGGFDPATGRAIFPDLRVYGASFRRDFLGGLINAEIGYYDSPDSHHGRDPFVNNSEMRYLLGYERELAQDFTVGVQWYVEEMLAHSNYEENFIGDRDTMRDHWRHLFTLRLTYLMLQQNLKLSLFTYYSPTDHDAYLRPYVHYKVTDNWAVFAGANIFWGEQNHTFFGQFENNTNVYAGARYSF